MKELKEKQLQYVSPAGFLSDQLLMHLPTVYLWVAGAWFCGFTRNGKKYILFFLSWLVFLTFLLVFQGKSYYALPAYPALFAFGAFYLAKKTEGVKSRRAIFIGYTVLTAIIFFPALSPFLKPDALARLYKRMHYEKAGLLKWEDHENHPLPQDFADMLGWEELALKTNAAYKTLTLADQKQVFVFTGNYGQAGALNYYRRTDGLAYPVAHSSNGSFILWLPKFEKHKNILFITEDPLTELQPVLQFVQSVTVADSIINPYAREKGTKILILRNPSEKFDQIMETKLREKRNMFTRD